MSWTSSAARAGLELPRTRASPAAPLRPAARSWRSSADPCVRPLPLASLTRRDAVAQRRAQILAADLADAGLGKRFDEHDLVRHLVGGESARAHPGLERRARSARRRAAITNAHVRSPRYASGTADDGGVVHLRMREQVVLDLLGRDLLAAAVDLILGAARARRDSRRRAATRCRRCGRSRRR